MSNLVEGDRALCQHSKNTVDRGVDKMQLDHYLYIIECAIVV